MTKFNPEDQRYHHGFNKKSNRIYFGGFKVQQQEFKVTKSPTNINTQYITRPLVPVHSTPQSIIILSTWKQQSENIDKPQILYPHPLFIQSVTSVNDKEQTNIKLLHRDGTTYQYKRTTSGAETLINTQTNNPLFDSLPPVYISFISDLYLARLFDKSHLILSKQI